MNVPRKSKHNSCNDSSIMKSHQYDNPVGLVNPQTHLASLCNMKRILRFHLSSRLLSLMAKKKKNMLLVFTFA